MVIDWIRRHLLAIFAVYAIVLPVAVSSITSTVVASNITHNRALIFRSQFNLEQGQISNGCHRLNVLRNAQNANEYQTYQFFVYTARLLKYSAKHPPEGTPKRSPQERKASLAFANRLIAIARRLTWTPLTDCTLAKRQGLGYQTPAPLTFARHPINREATSGRSSP